MDDTRNKWYTDFVGSNVKDGISASNFDSLKNDAFILILISIYILFIMLIYLNIKNFSNINLNINLEFFNSYIIQNYINKKINIFIF